MVTDETSPAPSAFVSFPKDNSTSAAATLATPPSDESPQSAMDETAQDAGGGKIRGGNGRFMPKKASRKTKANPKAKAAKKGMPEPISPKSAEPLPPLAQPSSPKIVEQAYFGPPFLLAAHAPSVITNLDKFPPGYHARNKRKRASSGDEGPRKRVRAGNPAAVKAKVEKAVEEELPKMATRRSTRAAAAAANLEQADGKE